MKRLTFEGNFCDIAQCAEVRGGFFCEDGACSQRKTWERLKQYEDTGLSPQEVDTLKEENARLHNENFWLTEKKEAAPEVVRCRECVSWEKRTVNEKGYTICPASGMEITEEDFCSYGERRIENAPVLDAEPVKRGKWIDLRESYNDVPKSMCSECGMVIIGLESEHPTCPRCNVEMDTERRGDDATD